MDIDRQRMHDQVLALPALDGCWQTIDLPADAHVFHRGDPGDALYAVVSGTLEVYTADANGRRVVLERIGPGQTVGELALLDGGVRSASLVAVAPSCLKVLRRDDFLATLRRSPELAELTIDLLSARMRRSAEYLALVTRWSRQVARGEYRAAETGIQAAGAAADDPNLARFIETFTEMVSAVRAREAELKRELHELRIEIDGQKYQRQLNEITETEFFQDLQVNARRMRRRAHGEADRDA